MSNNLHKREEALNTLLPFGETLKPLIISSSLSDNDLRFVLQKRGIFVLGSQKSNTAPLLCSALLSPKEFDMLKNRQHIKESNVKTSTAQANCQMSDVELIGLLTEESLMKILKANESEFSPIKTSKHEFYLDKDKIVIEGTSTRKDYTKDVFSYETTHTWKLTVEKPSNSNIIQFKSETTIPETKSFVQDIQKSIYNALKENGLIDKDASIQRVFATHFKRNAGLFQYLLAFIKSPYQNLVFKRISNINCGIDNKGNFPENFEWLKDTVDEISLQGRQLETSDIIELGNNGILIFGEIDADFSFDFREVKGKCTIRYGFPNYFEKFNQVEFESKIQAIELDKEFAHFSKEATKRLISAQFLQSKHQIFQKFVETGVADTKPKSKGNQYKLIVDEE